MTAQQLKNSILQMAVQGKLVPQDPNDEPASVLLERIRAEKERLIKEKKIKREKNPSVIFKGADNTPYEKIGDEVRSLADEVPFDIPDSWEWVRLGTVIELQSGQDMTPDKYNDCGKGIPYITGASNIENGIVLINRWTEYGRAFAYCGDILLTCKGTVGTMAVLQEPQVHIARQIMAIRPISELYVPYIQLVLDTLVENLKAAAKSMIPGIAREDVLQSLFPVPPVSEQKRIVQKVSDLSPCLEQYAAADTKLLSLNTAFPEALKKSILQEAVQGKLVPQDPSDEPAEALLERIRAEKQRLIKEGKIKKDKHESVIFRRDNSHYEKLDGVDRCIDDELPFEIPDSWVWVRLIDICEYIQRGKSPKYSPIKKYPVIAQKCNQWSGFSIEKAQFIEPESITSYGRERFLQDNDLMWNSTGLGTLGRMAVYKSASNPYGLAVADSHVTVIRPLKEFISPQYLYYYFSNPTVQSVIEDQADGTTKQKELSATTVRTYLVPLPPYNEQIRIVKQIETVLPLVVSV